MRSDSEAPAVVPRLQGEPGNCEPATSLWLREHSHNAPSRPYTTRQQVVVSAEPLSST